MFNAWTYGSGSLWAALVTSIQTDVAAKLPGGRRQLQSYRLRTHFAALTRLTAAKLLVPFYLLLATVLAGVPVALWAALRTYEGDDDDDGSASAAEGGTSLVSSVFGTSLITGTVALVPGLKAGWSQLKQFRQDLGKLAADSQAAARGSNFSGGIEDMAKVKEELDLLGDTMSKAHLRMLLYVDDLDRLGTKDQKAVEVMDQIFMLLGTETRMPVICIMAVDSDVVSRARTPLTRSSPCSVCCMRTVPLSPSLPEIPTLFAV